MTVDRVPQRPLARGAHGMVVTPHPLATLAGVDALRAGGNAVDAAVAANAVLAVVYAHACGLGGDAFALVWSPRESRLLAFNGSGRAPAALDRALVRERGHETMPTRGALTVTVPGAVDAWAQLVARLGRRTLADALLPAAEIADRGYAVTDRTSRSIAASETLLLGDPRAAATFLPAGKPPLPGARLRQPLLAATLRLLALEGRDAFYRGPIARDLVTALSAAGGVMALSDLAEHSGEWVEPVRTVYRDVEVCSTPPNSQGITALIALNVLDALRERGWPDLPADTPVAAEETLPAGRIHAQAEAIKVAWAERDAHVADPAVAPVDTESLLSRTHAATLAGRLDPNRAQVFEPDVSAGGGTVYLCAADSEGGMVSLIESNYMGFGAGIMAGEAGFMLQNRGAYFNLEDGARNALEPRIRPLHTLMPTMLLRGGRPWVVMGAMGGDGQPHTAVQLVNALVDDGLDPQQAVDRPRWVLEVDAPGRPLRRLTVEPDLADATELDALRARGHEIRVIGRQDPLMGWAQVIRREDVAGEATLSGGGDPRADSLALGI